MCQTVLVSLLSRHEDMGDGVSRRPPQNQQKPPAWHAIEAPSCGTAANQAVTSSCTHSLSDSSRSARTCWKWSSRSWSCTQTHRTFNQVLRMECLGTRFREATKSQPLPAWKLQHEQCLLLTCVCCTGMFESLKYFVSLHPRSEARLRWA